MQNNNKKREFIVCNINDLTRLRNIYLKQRTKETKFAYNQQRNKRVSILKKQKRCYFETLDVKIVKDNKKFGKKICPFCQTKLHQRKRSHLHTSSDIEVTKTFQNVFSSIVENLNIQRDETHLS